MSLPKIEAPKLITTVPSTGTQIEFRPFLVKEEKILLMAQESNDTNDILRAIKDIISACTFDNVNPDELATYDLEYLFLQIRAASVGETSEIQLQCSECKEYTPIKIDISKIKVQFPEEEIEKDVMLTSNIGITLQPISVANLSKFSETDPETMTQMMAAAIEKIYDDSNVYLTSEATDEEMKEFIESLNHKQVSKIEEFLSNQPTLSEKIEFRCKHCEHQNTVVLEGMQAFFE
jgi:hypothetical protein